MPMRARGLGEDEGTKRIMYYDMMTIRDSRAASTLLGSLAGVDANVKNQMRTKDHSIRSYRENA